MFEKVKEMARRYEEIERLAQDPAVIADAAKYSALMKERSRLAKWVTRYHELQKVQKERADAEALLSDKDMRELAEQDLVGLRAREAELVAQIEEMLLSTDENSARSVIVEIRPGVGGDEAALFANELRRLYVK